MTKDEFLQELRNNLAGKINNEEMQNILMDYEEIFTVGRIDNKSDEKISKEIGSPAAVCQNILDEYTYPQTVKPYNQTLYRVAPLGKRILAFIIDSVLSMLPLALLSVGSSSILNALFLVPIIPSLPLNFAVVGAVLSKSEIVFNVFLLLFFWLYGTVTMLILKNKTVGMLLMGMKVVKANNESMKVIDIVIRQFIGKILIPGLTFGLSNVISFFWALFSQTNNTVHDKIAGTVVVEAEKRASVQ